MNTQLIRTSSLWAGIGFRYRIALFLLACMALMAGVVSGQANTTVNLGTQARNPDFSSMPVTRPVSVGSSLPATCVVGQLFFNSSASAGNNLNSCVSTNTWSPVGANVTLPLSVANGGNGTSSPGLVAGTNVTVTGSWPNQTVNASGTSGGTSGNATSIQGSAVSATAPINNQGLVFNSTAAAYAPVSLYTLQNGLGTATSGTSNLQVNISMGIRAVTATSDSLVGTDCGGLVTYNNASGVAVAVPQPGLGGNFAAGCPVTLRNYGAGAVTMNLIQQHYRRGCFSGCDSE